MKVLYTIGFLLLLPFVSFSQRTPVDIDSRNYTVNKFGFVENNGQIRDQNGQPNKEVRYLLSTPGINVQLRQDGFSYDTYERVKTTEDIPNDKSAKPRKRTRIQQIKFHRVDVTFENANNSYELIPEGEQKDAIHYLYEKEIHARHYSSVTYKNLYPGIDLRFYINNEDKVEYDYIVKPGVEPDRIKFRYAGQNKLTTKSNTELALSVDRGDLIERIPASYLLENNEKLEVSYNQIGDNVFSFRVPKYDKTKTLVIDPTATLLGATYFGGENEEVAETVATDASGNIYIGGWTSSTSNIATSGVIKTTISGTYDAFIAKFNSVNQKEFATYLGGTGDDTVYGLLVDGSGNIFATGNTDGGSGFATTGQTTNAGGYDAFLIKVNDTGSGLFWGTYFGGSNDDSAYDITLDASGDPVIVGRTESTDLPVTSGSFGGGVRDAFVAKFSASSGASIASLYIGGTGDEGGVKLIGDGANNIFVVGWTSSTNGIVAGSVHQNIFGGEYDCFVMKYSNETMSVKSWGTYFGGTGDDEGLGVTLDAAGNVYVGGFTTSTDAISGGTVMHQEFSGGLEDGFVCKLYGSGGTREWSTYYGGLGDDEIWALVADANNIYACGKTASDAGIATSFAYQETLAGFEDAFHFSISYDGYRNWGTYFGGSDGDEAAYYNAIDYEGNIIIVGLAESSGLATADGFQQAVNGFGDAFIAKFTNGTPTIAAEPEVQPTGLSFFNIGANRFDYTFTHATGSHDGYIHLRKEGSPPTSDPVDGVEYFVDEIMPDGSLVQYSDNIPSGSSSSLTPGTTYYYKIYAYNGSGTSSNYLTTAPLSGSVTTLSEEWITKNSMQVARTYAAAGAIDGKLYVVGGSPGSGSTTSLEEYDPSTDTWTSKTSMPTSRALHRAAVVNGKLYVIGGCIGSDCNTGTTNTLEVYDPVTDGWQALANMPTARSAMTVGVIGDKIYVAGGRLPCGACNHTNVLEVYDVLSNSWSSTVSPMPMPAAVGYAVGGVINGKFYVAGGSTDSGSVSTLYEYDPVTNLWTQRASMPMAREGSGGGVINNQLYVVTGLSGGSPTNVMEAYDPVTNFWSTKAPIPTARYIPASAVLDNVLYVAGSGSSGTPITTVEAYITTGGPASEPNAPPTDLQFTQITSSGYDYSWTASTASNVTGYIGIRRVGAEPTFVPEDGIVYTPGSPQTDGSFIAFADYRLSSSFTSGTPNTIYYIDIYAYNGSGASINYLESQPLRGSITTFAIEPTAQPTNLQFSNIGTTTFTLSFNAATGSPGGYIGVASSSGEPDTDPQDGVTYTNGEALGNGFVSFVDSNTLYDVTGADPATTLYYKIYSFNGSGSSINYMQFDPLTGDVTTSNDDTPPVIVDNTPTFVDQGTPVTVSVNVTDDISGVSYVEMNYKKISAANVTSNVTTVELPNTGGSTHEFTIPASAFDAQGVEYEIYRIDNAGNEEYTPVKQVKVKFPDLTVSTVSTGADQKSYRIVSVPLILEKKTVKDILEDDLGPVDPKKWRIFRYENARNVELKSTSTLDVGKGYWLLNSQAGITIDTGPGVTAEVGIGKDFTIPVTNGWNQIGDPFNVNVTWADIQSANSGLGPLRVYNGSWSDGNTLTRFSGGFVNIPLTTGITQLTIPVAPGSRTAGSIDFSQPLNNPFWGVDLHVSAGSESYDLGGIGMHPDANIDYDRYDGFTLPRFFDFIELNHRKELEGIRYSKDIVPTHDNYEWEIFVETNLNEKDIVLSWDNSYFGNNGKQLILWDENQQRAIDMRVFNSYSFNKTESSAFRVVFGSGEYVKERTKPNRVVFHSVSPNPASESATFAFSLPELNEPVSTQIEVYNLLGQKIAHVLDNPMPAGYHEVSWKIDSGVQKPQSGVYISILKHGKSIAQQRLIIR